MPATCDEPRIDRPASVWPSSCMRWTVAPAVAALACTTPPSSSGVRPTAIPRPDGVDGTVLIPVALRYAGHHEGDHPTWSYRESVIIESADRAGRPVWRRTAKYSDDDSTASVIELDRQNLAPVHAELLWNGITQHVDFTVGQMTGTIEERGAVRAIRQPYQPAILADALDLYVAALPLAPGYRSEVDLFDFWLLTEPTHIQTRRFVIRVERQEQVTVPAGTRLSLVVAIEPTDGDQRLAAHYHVPPAAPHYALRMVYVVNPVSVGDEKRSIGHR
jgi:hypothetical protein